MDLEQREKKSQSPLTSFICVGCNRTSNCIDWCQTNNLLCYGAANSLAISQFNEEETVCQVIMTLSRHKDRVNAVRWLRGYRGGGGGAGSEEIVSASSDSSLILWRVVTSASPSSSSSSSHLLIKPVSIITSHTGPVTLVDGLYCPDSEVDSDSQCYPDTYLASASADSTVKLWLRSKLQEELRCVYTVKLDGGVCLSVSLVWLNEAGCLLMALGLDDSNIHLYSTEGKLLVLPGHEDWVRTLHFTLTGSGDVLLGSGSQDTTIRLWRFSTQQKKTREEDTTLSQHTAALKVNSVNYSVSMEALLLGHEAWVTSLQWKPNSGGEELVSCSTDRTVVLWKVEKETGVWLESSRLGELGGNTLGFLTILFSPHTNTLIANSHQGALHMWTNQPEEGWRCVGCVGGHSEAVVDIDWERPRGRYLLSCSLDKTTRLFVSSHLDLISPTQHKVGWFEASRPQVHGHSMAGLAALPGFSLASASEEKVVRVFTAPDNVLHNLSRLSHSFSYEERGRGEGGGAVGATLPSLGLSNKALVFSPAGTTPPQTLPEGALSEDELVQNTLWPEVMKLYGHGYEVYSVAATHAGDLLATACKASSPLHANIILWETEGWNQVGELEGHNLTVTQMSFSPDDEKLVSVSRDRTWCLFIRTGGEGNRKEFKLVSRSSKEYKCHSRIVWCCSWSYDSLYFSTGSRDCQVLVWPGDSPHIAARPPASLPLTHQHPVTALAFSTAPIPTLPPLIYLLAIGLESGTLHLYLWHPTAWTFLLTLPPHLSPSGSVSQLRFRPLDEETVPDPDHCQAPGDNVVQLASASSDHSVRIFTIDLQHFISNTTISLF